MFAGPGSAAYGFDPRELSGLADWLKGDAGIVLDSNLNVQRWIDQSGNGFDATQATAGSRPSYNASDATWAGKPSLGFTGTQYLRNTSINLPQPTTMVVFCSTPAALGTSWNIVDGVTSRQLLQLNANGDWNMYAGSQQNSSLTQHGVCAVVANFNGASSAIFVNSSTINGSPGNVGTNALTGLDIGSSGGTFGLVGSVAEVLVYSRTLSPAEVSAVLGYGRNRYGQPWS